jgi:endonuclease/exonuclease/phosphatase family metal-dependent hydrolase
MKLISYNAGIFGYFQSKWYVNEMVEKVNEIKPGVFCVQEFLNIQGKNGSTIDSVKKACGFEYVYFQKLKDGRKKGEYGMAVFSQYTIADAGLVQFDGLTGNMCVFADIKVDTAVYRIYNVHLQSFKFKKQDYKFVEKMPEDNDEKIRQSKNLLKRMKSAYIKRAQQTASIKEHMDACAVPYFVIGDFNDPPVSYSYRQLSEGLKDAFTEKGAGMGKTYIGLMPNFRIDYILFPEEFSGTHYKTYRLSSDHSMVSAGLKFKNE